jgi:hypothetical protein
LRTGTDLASAQKSRPSPFRRKPISVFILLLGAAMIFLVSHEVIKQVQPWRMANRGDCIVAAGPDRVWINRCTEAVNLRWCVEPDRPNAAPFCREREIAAGDMLEDWRSDVGVIVEDGPIAGVWRHACALPYRPVKRPDILNPGRETKACARPS